MFTRLCSVIQFELLHRWICIVSLRVKETYKCGVNVGFWIPPCNRLYLWIQWFGSQSIQSNVMEMLYMITTLWISCALVEKGPIFCSADVSGVIALLLNSQYLEKFLPPRWNIWNRVSPTLFLTSPTCRGRSLSLSWSLVLLEVSSS